MNNTKVYNSDMNARRYTCLSRLQIAYITSHRNITPSQYEALSNWQIMALISFAEKTLGMTTHRH